MVTSLISNVALSAHRVRIPDACQIVDARCWERFERNLKQKLKLWWCTISTCKTQTIVIFKKISMLDISEFDTFRVGLFLWPARSLSARLKQPRTGLVSPWAKPGSGLEIITWPVQGRRSDWVARPWRTAKSVRPEKNDLSTCDDALHCLPFCSLKQHHWIDRALFNSWMRLLEIWLTWGPVPSISITDILTSMLYSISLVFC